MWSSLDRGQRARAVLTCLAVVLCASLPFAMAALALGWPYWSDGLFGGAVALPCWHLVERVYGIDRP